MKNKEYNYGIAILRIFFCLMIVAFHYHGLTGASYKYYFLREVAAPVFMFIAFFFSPGIIESKDKNKYKSRYVRLLVPYICWGILYYIASLVASVVFNYNHATVKDLCSQLLLGNSENLNPPLWFNWELIIFTGVFIIAYFVFKEKGLIVFVILVSVVCYILQYTNLNYQLFEGCGYSVTASLGRMAELFPCATAGYVCGKYKVYDFLKRKRGASIACLVLLAIIIELFAQYIPTPQTTFVYSGVKHALAATVFVLLFYLLPFEKAPDACKRAIKFTAGYTMGVYVMHWGIGLVINKIWLRLFNCEKTILECVVIFVVCIFISWLISLVPNKYAKMLVE